MSEAGDRRAVMPKCEDSDPLAVMWDAVQSLNNIATSSGDNPTKEEIFERMDVPLGKLKGQILLLYNSRPVVHEQVPVPGSTKMDETDERNASDSSFVAKISKKTIQILDPTNTSATAKFSSALKNQMSNVDCRLLSKMDQLNQRMPLIVVCQLSGRLKADVALALETVEWSLQYVVIILHFGAESNLPAVPTATKMGGYDQVIFVDMGVTHKGEILNCRHNKNAKVQLNAYIDEFYKNVK